jgi:hypothetical protein
MGCRHRREMISQDELHTSRKCDFDLDPNLVSIVVMFLVMLIRYSSASTLSSS